MTGESTVSSKGRTREQGGSIRSRGGAGREQRRAEREHEIAAREQNGETGVSARAMRRCLSQQEVKCCLQFEKTI